MKLAADVNERPLTLHGQNRTVAALSRAPELRALPVDMLAQRIGAPRGEVERDMRALVRNVTGHDEQIAGLSFDEAIANASAARRPALSPDALNEAAGYSAGQSLAEHGARRRPGRIGRTIRMMGYDAAGYQPAPIPDLSCLLLSDIFPVTKRVWSTGPEPTDDEKVILNWQHPLIQSAQSPASKATIGAVSQGGRSWDQDANLPGGQHLSARNDGERKEYWARLQLLAQKRGWLAPPKIVPGDKSVGQWGHPMIVLEYWDDSDGSNCRRKTAAWDLQKLGALGSGDAVMTAVFGAVKQCTIENYNSGGGGDFGTGDLVCGTEGYDAEREALKNFSGLINTVNALATAIATVVTAYCPACGVAIKVAAGVATQIAKKEFGTTHALSLYGDLLLGDAKKRAMAGDGSTLAALRQFAMALIGQPPGSVASTPAGGLINDYLSTLGTSYGNVPRALYAYANSTQPIGSSAELSAAAGVPLLDCQYAVAAMTDTLTRFADNMGEVYTYQDNSIISKLLHVNRRVQFLDGTALQDIPLGKNRPPAPASGAQTVIVVAAAAGAIGVATGMIDLAKILDL